MSGDIKQKTEHESNIGHSSEEDAIAALQLVKYKLKQDVMLKQMHINKQIVNAKVHEKEVNVNANANANTSAGKSQSQFQLSHQPSIFDEAEQQQ